MKLVSQVLFITQEYTTQGSPALVAGADYRSALVELAHRPFRMAPYYDPGVWGATG